MLDEGAVQAIARRCRSLLPSGVVNVRGRFEIGEMVACVDEAGTEWARGITSDSSQETKQIAGRKSSEIEAVLGYKIRDEIIHRDELVVMVKR